MKNWTKARDILTTIWLASSVVLIVIAVLATMRVSEHEEFSGDLVFKWLLPAIIPTLGLIATAYVAEHNLNLNFKGQLVNVVLYRLALTYSLLYHGILLYILLSFAASPKPAYFENSGMVLLSLQGLFDVLLGVFFFKREQSQSPVEVANLPDSAP